jgi:hypothetical protein
MSGLLLPSESSGGFQDAVTHGSGPTVGYGLTSSSRQAAGPPRSRVLWFDPTARCSEPKPVIPCRRLTGKFRCCDRCDRQVNFCQRVFVLQKPSRRQPCPRENPLQQAVTFQTCSFRHQIQPSMEASRLSGDRAGRIAEIRIGKDIGKVEAALTDQTVRVDCAPAAITEVEHVVMVEVAMKDRLLSWISEQGLCCLEALGQNAAMR